MYNVLCVKWGVKYSPEYVNILKKMCDRHITIPYNFYCLTEDSKGIDENINIIKLPTHPGIKSWWSKLYMFSPELPIEGTVLYFDLDVVIFKNIDELFTFNKGNFQIIRDFNRCRVPDWKLANSSVMRWEKGQLDYLWNEFKDHTNVIMGNNHGDQDYITKRAVNDINYWPDEWIRSYKWEMMPRTQTKTKINGKWHHKHPAEIKEPNKVAVFHGKPDPHECGDSFVVDNWR